MARCGSEKGSHTRGPAAHPARGPGSGRFLSAFLQPGSFLSLIGLSEPLIQEAPGWPQTCWGPGHLLGDLCLAGLCGPWVGPRDRGSPAGSWDGQKAKAQRWGLRTGQVTGAQRQCWVVGEGPDRYCNKLCYSRQLLTLGLDFSIRKMGAWPASFSGYCESRGTGHRKYYSKCFQSIHPRVGTLYVNPELFGRRTRDSLAQ